MSGPADHNARLEHILERLAHHSSNDAPSLGDALCSTTVDVLTVAGAGITLHGPPDSVPYSIGLAGPDMAIIHDLERSLGEGPCIDAYRTGSPSWNPDLADPTDSRRPAFRGEALRTSARSAFGYPLHSSDGPIGALNLYDIRARGLTEDQHEDATLIADISSHVLLAGLTIGESTTGGEEIEDAIRHQDEVHQATGMVSVQLGIPIKDALARLRARAFSEGRSLSELSNDVVHRRTRFDPSG